MADSARVEVTSSKPYTGTGVMDDTSVIAVGVDPTIVHHASASTGRFSSGYDDFFGGYIRCPTCDGTRKVSREREHELVALIPMSDKRLHPRRTTLYVGISITLCIIVAALLLFFLFPRSISLDSDQPTLTPVAAGFSNNNTDMYMSVVNMYNMTNTNFYQVEVESVTASVLNNQRILQTVTNNTAMTIPMRSAKLYYVMLNVTFSSEMIYVVQYCLTGAPRSFLIEFQAMATFAYFGKSEQMTLSTYQYVHCPKRH
jgi:hypothetical protein